MRAEDRTREDILKNVYDKGVLRPLLVKDKPRYCVGLDLGQAQDHTAIAIVEKAQAVSSERDPVTYSFVTQTLYHVRHAERLPLGVAYPDIVEHVRRLVHRAPLEERTTTVAVDATGVGAPVVDLLRRGRLGCWVTPVVITGGEAASSDGVRYRVPKRDLMTGLQVAFQKRRIGLAQGLPMLAELREELRSMRVQVAANGFERYSGRRHDDLVLALALAWWWSSRFGD